MAKHLQDIFATEKDKVNCPFYYKIGVCRHGDRCSRIHLKPVQSQTLLFKGMWQNPAAKISLLDGESLDVDDKAQQEAFEEFYEDIFLELQNFGQLEELHVVDNLGDHMIGNVYAKFSSEDDSIKCGEALSGRYYAGRPLFIELCPVTNFREARCRQFDVGECTRSAFCNFLHLKPISTALKRKLYPGGRRSRSRSPPRRGGGYDDRRGGYDDRRGGYDRGGYDRDRDRGGSDRAGPDRGGSDRAGPDRGGYDRGYDRDRDRGGYDRGYDRRSPPRAYDRSREPRRDEPPARERSPPRREYQRSPPRRSRSPAAR